MSQRSEKAPRVPDLGRFGMGEWEVNQAENALFSEGRCVRVEPRVMDVLVYLVAESGRVVSKDELLTAVWNGAFVEEGALAQAVHSLRKALGDDARQPRYIQTIPKRGYRLVASVAPGETLSPASAPDVLPVPKSLLRRRYPLLLAVAIGLATILILWQTLDRRQADAVQGKPRIVVLPFRNFGETQDGYFTEGLSEEITRDLASLASLHVIAQTSAMRYARDRKPLSQIAEELEVDYVLEGTVVWGRGAGDEPRVRIAPRLFQVATDARIRAEPYERRVEDIFEVKTEISRWVLDQLDVPIPLKGQTLRTAPTEHPEAYQAYRRGLEIRDQPYYSEEHIRRAVPMFQRAIELDPRFAAAWAELSQSQSYLAFNADPSPTQMERALQPLRRALEIDPSHPDVRLAEAYFSYRCLGKYETAEKQLTEAARLYPNDPRFLEPLAYVLRRRGRLKEAIEKLERAASLDPLAARLVLAIGETYRALREYEQADLYYTRATSMAPDQVSYWVERALNEFAWTGDVDKARKTLEESPVHQGHPELMTVQFLLDFYEREYERALGRITPESLKTQELLTDSRLRTLAVIARERLGDARGARAAAEENRAILAARVARFPMDPFHYGYLAMTLAQLGRKDEAVAEMGKALQVFPNDLFTSPRTVEIQAMVEATLGHRREAISLISRLLSTPYQSSISATDLRLDPVWDPLHEDADFKKLLWKM